MAKAKRSVQTSKLDKLVEKEKVANETIPLTKRLNFRPSKTIIIILVIVGLLALAYYKKSWFVAATVNGSPVTNLELQNKLNAQYKEQVLNQMVNEKVILDEGRKRGVSVTDEEISSRISQIEQNVGGPEMLDQLLSQQGQTKESLKNQIKIQLTIEKLYQNEASISAQEVADFITQNGDQLTSSGSAQQANEARDILKQQKTSQIFNQKFQELKDNANIQIF